MNDIIETIQRDILDPVASLNTILLKAKVLAHLLKNDRFKQWVVNELDGYPDAREIPDYRIIDAPLLAFIYNGYNGQKNVPISLLNCPDWFQDVAGAIRFTAGVHTAEEFGQRVEAVSFPWQAEAIAVWNEFNPIGYGGYHAIEVTRPVTPQHFAQIVRTVRSRLQDFILELSDLPWNIGERPLTSEQIEKLVAVTIYNIQGENVSNFDQRGQQVQSQNNAARDVNISGGINVNNNESLIQSVRDLRGLLSEVAPDKQDETSAAIEILENAAQDDSVRRSQVVQAVETISQVPAMRQHLENLAIGTTGSIAATAIIEGIKFALGIGT